MISPLLLTKMKGIDYDRIQEYLSRVEQKKLRLRLKKSQDCKNIGGEVVSSSRQELYNGSEANLSDSKVPLHSSLGLCGSNNGHYRGGSSITENLAFLSNKKYSKSYRRENLVSQSYQLA